MDSDRFVFECSWEVCHKIGGIYTVVKSKAALLSDKYKNYFLIGPYFKRNADIDLEEKEPPSYLKRIFDDLKDEGIVCHYGSWNIKGNPKTILIDFSDYWENKDGIKKKFWDDFRVDSLRSGSEFDEAVVWASAAGRLIEKVFLSERDKQGVEFVCHSHEWLAGAALLYIKSRGLRIGTVFTTHATILGRTLAASGFDLYDNLSSFDPEAEAKKHGVIDKWSMEKACANNADIFTTVSEITSIEAEHILGRKADVLLMNGLDVDNLPTYEDLAVLHKKNKKKIHDFLRYYFHPYYYFDVTDTSIFFIVGRYEFKNKGIDVLIDALAKLNDRLKKERSTKTIICFFWIPREVHGVRPEISTNKISYIDLKDFIHENLHELENNIVANIVKTGISRITVDDLSKNVFHQELITAIKKREVGFIKQGNPPLATHNIPFEAQDIIIQNLLKTGLDNKEDDRVKVIFYPIYLSGVDGLTDLSYYDAMNACHLGIFPSYYEPWGYTPLEAAAVGIPSVTTDLAGFGRFLKSKDEGDSGIYVLERFKRPYDKIVESLSDVLYDYSRLDTSTRVKQKIRAKELSTLADWKIFVKNYFDAHDLAVKKMAGTNQ